MQTNPESLKMLKRIKLIKSKVYRHKLETKERKMQIQASTKTIL